MTSPETTILLRVNGESMAVPQGSILTLLDHLEIGSRHVAVECNRKLVPKAEFESTTLSEGDELELVTLVGGG